MTTTSLARPTLGQLSASVDGIFVGVTVRVSHRDPAGLRTPRRGSLGVVRAIAFNGDPTVELDDGDIFVAYRDVFDVQVMTGIEAPDGRTTGRWRVKRMALVGAAGTVLDWCWAVFPVQVLDGIFPVGEDIAEVRGRQGMREIRSYQRAVRYATRMARENLR